MDLFGIFQPVFVIVLFGAILWANSKLFKRVDFVFSKDKQNIYKGMISLFLLLIGVVVFIFSLPINENTKSQILSLLGIVLSAGIALSSTTMLSNLIAGFMNSNDGRFKVGDLVEVENIKGRVTKNSFFYTEIQLPDSNFITVPNLFLANKPLKNTRKSDTIISTEVSLGYDISRKLIEKALKKGAKKAGLTKTFVYITSLGDFSIVYKISGFLEDSDNYFSTYYSLNKYVLDALHDDNIEIVSPSFMNQRQIGDKEFIAKLEKKNEAEESLNEDQIFDKAKTFEKLESTKEKLQKKLDTVQDKEEKSKIKEKMKKIENTKERVENDINEEEG